MVMFANDGPGGAKAVQICSGLRGTGLEQEAGAHSSPPERRPFDREVVQDSGNSKP